MHHDLDPALLFGPVLVLAAAVALLLWRANRGVAVVAGALAAISALCLVNEKAARAAHASIRVDLLVTIPVVSVAAMVVGIFAVRRPPLAGRMVGAALLAVGAPWLAWFAWTMTRSTFEAQAMTRTFGQARRLYSEETLLCQGNLVKRFGPLAARGGACSGHLVVTSRSGYPFTRAIVNDEGQLYLLFSSQQGTEDNWMLGDGPVTRLNQGTNQMLTGERLAGSDHTRVELRPTNTGACEAKIDRNGHVDLLTLKKIELPLCEAPAAAAVRFVGAWGAATPELNGPQFRHLTQIWLWDTDGTARGLLLTDLAPSGMQRDYSFTRLLRGNRRAENQWELRADGEPAEPPFIFTLSDGRARITGSESMFRPSGDVLLEPKEFASHPKIAMAPVRDRARFALYFDNVFFNLNVPWTVP
ncbi:MAG: hypothetical protein LAP39_01770 [Acidobacteriia bacterium]|nr:hypothetical protein [Terriglobia bacterium]